MSSDFLKSQAAALKTGNSLQRSPQVLAEVKAHLSSLGPKEASRAIQVFLDSKEDAQLKGKFSVGADGFLTDAPTLRTFLLDQLGRADPSAAAAYAEKILGSMDSAEEWALALRSYALGNSTPQGRLFLEQKLQAMFMNEPWQKEASIGFLEAFDVAVYLGGTNLMPPLTALVRQTENQAVSHAAYLALDRLAISDPATVLNKLQTEPDLMKGREATRANYLARADAGDAQQRAVLENYLLNSQLSPAELSTFAGLYPNANYMVSYNLLTRTQTPDHASLVRKDRDALSAVESWLNDPRFEKIKPQLQTIKTRLETFMKQASNAK